MLLQNSSILGAYIARPRWVCCWQGFLLSRRGGYQPPACSAFVFWREDQGPPLRCSCKHGGVAGGKNFCFCIVRATSVLAFLHQNANAKAEFAYLRANMSVATAQRRLRAHCGGSKGESLGAAMFACLRTLTSKLAISACRNLFSLVRSLPRGKE